MYIYYSRVEVRAQRVGPVHVSHEHDDGDGLFLYRIYSISDSRSYVIVYSYSIKPQLMDIYDIYIYCI